MAELWVLGAPSFQFPEPMIESQDTGGQAAHYGGPVTMKTKRFRIRQHCKPYGHKMRVGPKKYHNKYYGTREGGRLHVTDITQSQS